MADQLGGIGIFLFWDIVFKGEGVEEELEMIILLYFFLFFKRFL